MFCVYFTGNWGQTEKQIFLPDMQLNFLQNNVCFPQSKTVGVDTFPAAESVIFMINGKHIKTL